MAHTQSRQSAGAVHAHADERASGNSIGPWTPTRPLRSGLTSISSPWLRAGGPSHWSTCSTGVGPIGRTGACPGWRRPEQTGAPVLAFSRDEVLPGENVHAVILTLFPQMVDRWNLEVEPGVVLPMYEGSRVCGHGTVLWRANTTLPLDESEERRFLRWLADPAAPLDAM